MHLLIIKHLCKTLCKSLQCGCAEGMPPNAGPYTFSRMPSPKLNWVVLDSLHLASCSIEGQRCYMSVCGAWSKAAG